MPRRARLIVPGIPWHIIQRGNNRSVCFYAETDYQRYLGPLGGAGSQTPCVPHLLPRPTFPVYILVRISAD